MKKLFLTLALIVFAFHVHARTLYVSPTGNDLNPGTFESPFATISKGYSTAVAGDTIMLRGGTYMLTGTTSISKSGTNTNRYYLFAYPGEHPVLDYSTAGTGSRGINLTGSYWYMKGLDIYRASDNGMHTAGSDNIIELCIFRENGDTGLQLDTGASNNQIINCDSYFNVDATQGNADGFAPKLTVGTGNYFFGCRSWQNSDDGWDGYLRPADNMTTTLENCWVFRNGYLKNGSASTGNGNGFKMGGGDNGNVDSLRHNMILINCLAFDNRVKGFDQNNNRGSMTLLNCTAYRNGTNYQISAGLKSGSVLTVKNCAALGAYGSLGSFAVQATNSWMPQFTVTTADFQSIDTTGIRGPRQADGSLPILPFMRLAPGSDLIDAGTNIGRPFNGTAPDLGCFETNGTTSVNGEPPRLGAFKLEQNYPNPFNPTTEIKFTVDNTAPATLHVYNILGQQVLTLFDGVAEAGRSYSVKVNRGGLSSGMYFYRLQSGVGSELRKLIVLK